MIRTYFQTVRGFNRDVKLILLSSGLFGFSLFTGVQGLLLNLYLLRMGYGPEFVGLVLGTGSFVFGVSCLPGGFLGSRFESRSTIIAGTSVMAIAFLILTQAELIPATFRKAFIVLCYSTSLMGWSLYRVNSSPYLMEITPSEERTHVFSVFAALMPLSGFAGNLLGGILVDWLSRIFDLSLDDPAVYRYTLTIAGLLVIPGVLAISSTEKRRVNTAQDVTTNDVPMPFLAIIFIGMVSLFHMAGEGAVRSFFNVYLDDDLHVPVSLIGTILAFAQAVGVPAALSIPVLSDRYGKFRTVIVTAFAVSAVIVPMCLASHWIVASMCFLSIMALTTAKRPAFVVFSQELVPARWRAVMSGVTWMMSGLGYGSMAMSGGFIIAGAGFPSLFALGSGLTAVGTVLFWAYFRRFSMQIQSREIQEG